MNKAKCGFTTCGRDAVSRGHCGGHYQQLRAGKTLAPLMSDINPRERFSRYVKRTAGCWLWTGAINGHGYGYFSMNKGDHPAHRVAYEWEHGAVPQDTKIDHICHNRACVNVSHLRAVTNKQNMENRSGAQANSKTGIRGVSWKARSSRWVVQVKHGSELIHGGYFDDIEEAEKVAIELRNRLFTHNNLDRKAREMAKEAPHA